MSQNQWSDVFVNAHKVAFGVSLLLLIIWSMIWKGIALWKAARHKDLAWFVIMFLINTIGILEIIYIFGFSHKNSKV